jgi:hypothetical protein
MLFIPAENVSHRVVQLAKQPRRTVIVPWWFGLIAWGENHFPGIADYLIRKLYTDPSRRLEQK